MPPRRSTAGPAAQVEPTGIKLAKEANMPAGGARDRLALRGAGFRDGHPPALAPQLRSLPGGRVRKRLVTRRQIERREHLTLPILPAQRMSLVRPV